MLEDKCSVFVADESSRIDSEKCLDVSSDTYSELLNNDFVSKKNDNSEKLTAEVVSETSNLGFNLRCKVNWRTPIFPWFILSLTVLQVTRQISLKISAQITRIFCN